MKVGYFQLEPEFGKVDRNIRDLSDRLGSIECDLLVLPELAFSGYQFLDKEEVFSLAEPVPQGPTTQTCIGLAQRHAMHLVVGLPERYGDQCFNSAVVVGPKGFLGVYRKTHLFFEETLWFAPGDTGFHVWDIGPARIGVLVCFDWVYPEAARSLALKGADILCHPSNLVLPHCPDAMVTRCLENRVFSITANRIGQEARKGKPPLTFIGKSEVVSPGGRILHRSPIDKEELMVVDIVVNEARDKTINPYNDLFRDRRPHWYAR